MKRFSVMNLSTFSEYEEPCVYDNINKEIYSIESSVAEADRKAKFMNELKHHDIKRRKSLDQVFKELEKRQEK